MVASKPAKAAKYSYAERVLGAFSQARKQHRNHPVHMATLRAQVKKNAEAKQDKLGPKWPNWVAKAVRRLENEGILAPVSSGSVVMTPNGKKAIAVARKSLAIASNTSPTAVEEESLWKAIAHGSQASPSVRGTKRTRSSTGQPTRDDPDEDDLLSSPAPRRRARTKRARTSLPTGKKSISHMTRSQLRGTLRTLESKYDNVLQRSMSPLTDLDENEERERLRAELRARDDEIERIRRQIDQIRPQTAPPGPSEHRGRFQTPQPPYVQEQRPTNGVIRTQSGSLICDVSKRPTPAPSSPGEGQIDDTGMMDLFGDYGESVSAGPSSFLGTVGVRNAEVLTEIARLKAMTEEAAKATEEREHEHRSKVSALEKEVESRVVEIQEQKAACAKLSGQISTLEQQIKDRDLRVSTLDEQIASTRADLDHTQLELTSEKHQNAFTAATLAEREAEFAQIAGELLRLLEQRKSLDEQLADQLSKNASVEAALNISNASNAALEGRVADGDSKITELSERLESAQKHNSELGNQIISLESVAAKLRDEWSSYKQQAENSAAKQSEALAQARAEMDMLAQSLDQARASENTWHEAFCKAEASHAKRVAVLSAEVKRLQSLLDEAESTASMYKEKASESESTVAGLSADLSSARDANQEAQDALVALENQRAAELRNCETSIAAKEESLSAASRRIDSLSAQLGSAKIERNKAREELSSRTKDLSEIQAVLAAERLKATRLDAELGLATSRARDVEEELVDLRRSKEGDEKTIETLKETFEELREGQLRSLTELGNKIHSAQSTPVSKKRLTFTDL